METNAARGRLPVREARGSIVVRGTAGVIEASPIWLRVVHVKIGFHAFKGCDLSGACRGAHKFDAHCITPPLCAGRVRDAVRVSERTGLTTASILKVILL